MTWQELQDAITGWGVKPHERIVGIRLRSDGGPVGIRRTRHGIEIANVGRVAWLLEAQEDAEPGEAVDVRGS